MAFHRKVIGIDLAGSTKRDSGVAVLSKNKFLLVATAKSDAEMLSLIKKYRPELVAIDAPLSLPGGRKSLKHNNGVHFRECDIQLRKAGIRFFPITLGPMRMLTARGMRLSRKIRRMGVAVIEVFPGAAYDMLGVQRKDKRGILKLFRKLDLGFEDREYTQDELDGMCCAHTALLVLEEKARAFSGKDGAIWAPASGKKQRKANLFKPLYEKIFI